jgi:hypothetical protein
VHGGKLIQCTVAAGRTWTMAAMRVRWTHQRVRDGGGGSGSGIKI